MPETVPNTTIILYKGVPLIKGGTEVLLLSGAAAANALASFAFKTFTACTYTREERSYLRVPAAVSECEGCNYVSFRNANHGGKYFFGFIDHVRYINEATTQIDFTIDPFTTFSGDAQILPDVYVKRNTPVNDVRGTNLQPDYMPDSAKQDYTFMAGAEWVADRSYIYYAIGTDRNVGNDMLISAGFSFTGIRVGDATEAKIKDIKEEGGVLIGAYLMPSNFYRPYRRGSGDDQGGGFGNTIMFSLGQLVGNPLLHVASYSHSKIKSGVYNSVMLFTSQGAKAYELEMFANVENVVFDMVGLMTPGPSIFIYPRNYKGIDKNLAEGVYIKFPAIPITANAVYTKAQLISDSYNEIAGGISGAVSGASGGVWGALAGAALGMLKPLARDTLDQFVLTKYKPPQVIGSGDPVISSDFKVFASLVVSSPSAVDLNRISNFFDYYGYNIEAQQHNTPLSNHLNTANGAFVQVGSPMFAGSEADDELNARAYAGIKIRTSFT